MENPSPYLSIWIGCKKWSSESHKLLPSSGGWLDQDLETLMALEMLDDIHQQILESDAEWERAKNNPDTPHSVIG